MATYKTRSSDAPKLKFRTPLRVYHFTSWEAWEKIQREGLVPQRVNNPVGLVRRFGEILRGNWVLLERPDFRGFVGNALETLIAKGSARTVGLSFVLEDHEIARAVLEESNESAMVFMFHDGNIHYVISGILYDQGAFETNAPCVLVNAHIPPERLRLETVWGFAEIWNRESSPHLQESKQHTSLWQRFAGRSRT